MTHNQNQSEPTDKSNQKQQGNSMPQEVPAPDTSKPAQQPAPEANQDNKDQSDKSSADAASKSNANDSGPNGHKMS